MNEIEAHIRDLEDYNISESMDMWERVYKNIGLSENERKRKQLEAVKNARKMVRLNYKAFPRASNPTNKKHETLFFYLFHLICSMIPILNAWIYYKFFNLFFRSVKMNAYETSTTKTIKNHKRDRRFKKGYRDESIRWQKVSVVPNPKNPYWNLIDAEAQRNKKWIQLIGVGYILINAMDLILNEGIFFTMNILFLIIGLVASLIGKKVNKRGSDFSLAA